MASIPFGAGCAPRGFPNEAPSLAFKRGRRGPIPSWYAVAHPCGRLCRAASALATEVDLPPSRASADIHALEPSTASGGESRHAKIKVELRPMERATASGDDNVAQYRGGRAGQALDERDRDHEANARDELDPQALRTCVVGDTLREVAASAHARTCRRGLGEPRVDGAREEGNADLLCAAVQPALRRLRGTRR